MKYEKSLKKQSNKLGSKRDPRGNQHIEILEAINTYFILEITFNITHQNIVFSLNEIIMQVHRV